MNLGEWLKSFLSDTDGRGSDHRIISLAVTWTFMFTYIRVALMTQTMPPLDIGWAVMIGGILGIKSIDTYIKEKLSNGRTEKTP